MGYAYTEVDPADYYHATSTYFTQDFSSVAKFVLLDGDKRTTGAKSGEELNLDLLVTNVSCSLGEHNHIQPYIGDFFGMHYYGRSPIFAQVAGTLVDTVGNYNKAYLVSLYKNTLRAKAVAKTRVSPCLIFPGMALQGPVVGMTITETSELQDAIQVNFKIVVMRLLATATTNNSTYQASFDFTGASTEEARKAETPAGSVEFALLPPIVSNTEVI